MYVEWSGVECNSCRLHLCFECYSHGCPASSFITARDGKAFTCVSLLIYGDSVDPMKIGHLVLGVWLTAWSFLWSVAEPCSSRGGRV